MPRYTEPPRVHLALLPTPIDHLASFSRDLEVEVFVKRDDLTGAALSGNKVRKLEYVLARAHSEQRDVVLTCGGAQSNHCRTTALAGRHLGLDVELFLRGAHGEPVVGNLFLDLLAGATVHAMTADEYRERERIMADRAEELEASGRSVLVIPEGASDALGACGYVRCAEEISVAERHSEPFDAVVVAVGSGGTLAGLLAGAWLYDISARIIGVPVCDDAAHFKGVVSGILEELGSRFIPGLPTEFPDDRLLDGHVGQGYGQATSEELLRIQDVCTLTGLILDPVYTNKAFGGLLHLIRTGRIPRGSRVLFVHTGGIFGTFPFVDRMPHLMVP